MDSDPQNDARNKLGGNVQLCRSCGRYPSCRSRWLSRQTYRSSVTVYGTMTSEPPKSGCHDEVLNEQVEKCFGRNRHFRRRDSLDGMPG